MEQELDLLQLWQVITRRWFIMLLFPLLAASASYAYTTQVLVPLYQASTTLLVMKPPETYQLLYQDVILSRQLANTYREIVRSAAVLDKVAANLQLPYSAGALRGQVNVASVGDTEIINISAINADPELARDIANEVARVFMSEIVDLYKVENVSQIDRAVTPVGPFTPNVQRNMMTALAVGLMAAVGLAFLLEFLDKTIKTPEDVQKHLQLPVLGIIPYVDK